jgi:ribosomal protein L18E
MHPEETKETYQHKTTLRLKKIRTRISSLEKKAEKAEANIEVRHDQKLSHIRGQYAQVKEKLDVLNASTQEVWLEIKTVVDEALDALEEAVDVIAHRISGQTED